jgi:hypothetical protein
VRLRLLQVLRGRTVIPARELSSTLGRRDPR